MFEAAIKLDKKKAEPHIELARMYIAMNERGLAITSANKAVKLAPLSSQAWNTNGRAELNAHELRRRDPGVHEGRRAQPGQHVRVEQPRLHRAALKQYEDAAEHLTEATERKDATGYMFNNLGTALEHLDRSTTRASPTRRAASSARRRRRRAASASRA